MVNKVPKNNKKNTTKGLAARAKALAKKARDKTKTYRKSIRRAVINAEKTFAANVDLVDMAGLTSVHSGLKVAKSIVAPSTSPCVKKWFDCLTDPFSQKAMGACIPAGDAVSSMRQFGFSRFSVGVNSAGFGFALFMPSLARDSVTVFYTDPSYPYDWVQPLLNTNVLETGVNKVDITNQKFQQSDFYLPDLNNTYVKGRLVGGGVRVQYTGMMEKTSGLYYWWVDPSHTNTACLGVTNSISTPVRVDTAALGGYNDCVINAVSRAPREFPLSPMHQDELTYQDVDDTDAAPNLERVQQVYPWANDNRFYRYDGTGSSNGTPYVSTAGGPYYYASPSGYNCGAPIAVLLITGAYGNQHHVEYGMHSEIIGAGSNGMRLPAESDVQGVASMMAALSRATIDSVGINAGSFATALRKNYAEVVAERTAKVRL